MGNEIVLTFATAMSAALALGYAAHRLGLSPLVGFLLAGVAVGPHVPGINANSKVADQFAEMGIILLMFGVGLKFHIHELVAIWRISLPGALFTCFLTTLMTSLLLTAIGISPKEALIGGLAISVASTVVLMRILGEHRDLSTRAGHIAVGWVVIEDILTVMLLVALPIIAAQGTDDLHRLAYPLFIATIKIALCAIIVILVGGRVIPWILGKVSATHSRELFTLATLALAPGMALLAVYLFGVSMALGAFLAGLVVGRSDYSARAAAEALPLRDAFAVLFFVSIGLLFNPLEIITHPLPAIVLIAVVLIGKPFCAAMIIRICGESRPISIQIGAALGQIGEFTFVIGTSAKGLKLIGDPLWNGLVAASMISISLNPAFYRRFRQRIRRAANRPSLTQSLLPGHAIVVGFGDVGEQVYNKLLSQHIPVTIVDSDIVLVRKLQQKGIRTFCGDGSSNEVLNEAGLGEASALLVCCPIAEPGQLLHGIAKRLPSLRIAIRCMEGMSTELTSGKDFTVINEDFSAAGDITDVATGKTKRLRHTDKESE